METNYLRSDELDFELAVRGYPTDGTVDEKRKRLRPALRLERDGAVFSFSTSLEPRDEVGVCGGKVEELKGAIDAFNFANAAAECKRIRSRLLHVVGRLNRIDDQSVAAEKGQLLVRCGEISDFLEESMMLLDAVRVPEFPSMISALRGDVAADATMAEAALPTNGPDNRGSAADLDRGHNVSLLDVDPDDLAATISGLQLEGSIHTPAAPGVRSVPVTGGPVVVSSALPTSVAYTDSGSRGAGLMFPRQTPSDYYRQSDPIPPHAAHQAPIAAGRPVFPQQQRCSVLSREQGAPVQYSAAGHRYDQRSQPSDWPTSRQSRPPVGEDFSDFHECIPDQSSRRVSFAEPPHDMLGGVRYREMQGDRSRIFKTVSHWNISFDGSCGVNSFLERVEELRVACGFSTDQLMSVAVTLFRGSALDWFRANITNNYTWNDLVSSLRAAFLSGEYEEDIWTDIRNRTQGQQERSVTYISVMQNLFNKLSDRPHEQTRLRMIRRNLLPELQSLLSLHSFSSIAELTMACHQIEDTQLRIQRFKPPPTKPSSVTEQELMYDPRKCKQISAMQSSASTSLTQFERAERVPSPARVTSSAVTCWNCRQRGHVKRDCSRPPSKHCFGCGRPDVIKAECPRCSGNARPAH